MSSTLQPWLNNISIMQQSVLLSAIRGPDGMRKRHPAKMLIRWYRRCVLISAFDGRSLTDPYVKGGGSFTGPSITTMSWAAPINDTNDAPGWYRSNEMAIVTDDFIDARDEMTLHYYAHFMHAAEIIGYKHPDKWIAAYWTRVYARMAEALHLWGETSDELDKRLGDNEDGWKARNDPSTTCSD